MVEVEHLRQSELFAGLGDKALRAIAAFSEEQVYEAGHVIFRSGEPGRRFYVLVDGLVEVKVEPKPGLEMLAALVRQPGECFGWVALLGRDHAATARALARTRVVAVDGPELVRALEMAPATGYVVMRRLAAVLWERLEGARGRLSALVGEGAVPQG